MYGYLFWRGRGLVSGFLTLWDSFFSSSHDPFELLRERKKKKTDVRVCQTVIHIIYNHHFTLVAKSRCKLRKRDIFILRWWRAHLCEFRHLKRNAPGLKDLFLPRTTYNVLLEDVPRLIVSIHLWWEIHRVSSSLFVGYQLEIVFLSPQKRRHTCKV